MAVAAILIGERFGRRSCGIEVDMLEYVMVCFGAWRDQSCPANFVEDQGGVAVTKPWGPLEDLRYWRYLIALPPCNVLIALDIERNGPNRFNVATPTHSKQETIFSNLKHECQYRVRSLSIAWKVQSYISHLTQILMPHTSMSLFQQKTTLSIGRFLFVPTIHNRSTIVKLARWSDNRRSSNLLLTTTRTLNTVDSNGSQGS